VADNFFRKGKLQSRIFVPTGGWEPRTKEKKRNCFGLSKSKCRDAMSLVDGKTRIKDKNKKLFQPECLLSKTAGNSQHPSEVWKNPELKIRNCSVGDLPVIKLSHGPKNSTATTKKFSREVQRTDNSSFHSNHEISRHQKMYQNLNRGLT
jgi:hypothetical protein